MKFAVVYLPCQLFPGTSQEGGGKYEWYKTSLYDNDEEKMQKFTAIVSIAQYITRNILAISPDCCNPHR